MHVVKVDSTCYLVGWKYRDFLRLGHDFQGGTIARLERYSNLGSDYVRVFLEVSGDKKKKPDPI